MNRYKITKVLGDGTYGSVSKAVNNSTGEAVAIKKMKQKYYSWEECMKLREVSSLRKLIHPNIVKLKEVIRENDELHMVFEMLEGNLYEFMKSKTKPLQEAKVRNIMYQTLQALAYTHSNGYFHRDMKPENLLVTGDTVKLADFGLAREIRARPPFTDYVSTRWYRAPEVLLRSAVYNSPVDVWACGGIMAELYTLRPLLPGSSESDQLYKICTVLGTPTQAQWPEGHKLAIQLKYKWPTIAPTKLQDIVRNANSNAIAVMYSTMHWDPSKRSSAANLLKHPYFDASMQETGAPQSNNLPQLNSNVVGSSSDLPPQGARAAPKAQPALNITGSFGGDSLFNPLRSWKAGSSGPSGFYKADSSKDVDPGGGTKGSGFNLPPLQQEGSRKSTAVNSGKNTPGQRYLNMARYKPGMEQTPSLPSVQQPRTQQRQSNLPAMQGLGGPRGVGQNGLPDLNNGPKPGYLGAHAARMLA